MSATPLPCNAAEIRHEAHDWDFGSDETFHCPGVTMSRARLDGDERQELARVAWCFKSDQTTIGYLLKCVDDAIADAVADAVAKASAWEEGYRAGASDENEQISKSMGHPHGPTGTPNPYRGVDRG